MRACQFALAALSLRSTATSFQFAQVPRPSLLTARFLSKSDQYGTGMDQNAMMETDMLIVVDENDVVQNGVIASKKEAHTFGTDSPRGTLHRAFSFFLFNKEAELLLTRRADSKITFPGVWTNTACSHPLQGMIPDEVDQVPAAYPEFPKTKIAVTRKLQQELGIVPSDIPHDKIAFVSRFHYWAADTVTYGDSPPWGEHEVDYIFFIQVDEEPSLDINPDEVAEYKYVSSEELRSMFDDPALKWSPWFLGIMERGGFKWWEDLEGTLQGKHTTDKVEFFDPPKEHFAAFNLPSHSRLTGVHSASSAENK